MGISAPNDMGVHEWAMHMCGWVKLLKVSLASDSFIVACKQETSVDKVNFV